MMRRIAFTGGLLLFYVAMLALTGFAQDVPPVKPKEYGGLVDPELLEFVKVFGFGFMIFIVWWRDARKIDKLTGFAESFNKLSEDYKKVAEDSRDTAVMCARVNARLVDKLEAMERREERKP